MFKRAKSAIVQLLIWLVLFVPADIYLQAPAPLAATPLMERIEGGTNLQTVSAIAERLYPEKVRNILITDGRNGAADFAACVLAADLDAPLLLKDQSSKDQSAMDYVRRHLAKGGTIWLIGGQATSGEDGQEICGEEFAPSFAKVKRIGGKDQYETAALIAQQLGKTKTAVICSGADGAGMADVADTASIAAIAAGKKWPILLARKDELPPATRDYLLKFKPQNIYLLGGEGALAYHLEDEIKKLLPSARCERLQGYNRLNTYAQILSKFLPNPCNLYFASAEGYDLALAGSLLAAKTKGALVLCSSAFLDLPPALDDYIASLKEPASVYVLGGQMAVSDETVLNAGGLEQPAGKKTDFVNLAEYIPSLIIDLPYATTDNFTHTKLYAENVAYLRKGTADKLKKAVEELNARGYRVKIWDAYRPPAVQFKMWSVFPNSTFVANPWTGYSDHARGSAVDITLDNLEMPSGFDEFSPKAYRINQNENSKVLEEVMVKYGFIPLDSEWWHFSDSDTKSGIYQPVEQVTLAPQAKLRPNKIEEVTVSAIGDVILGQDERFGNFDQYYRQYGPQYFFAGVREILSKDSLTIANLEGTLTKATEKIDKSSQKDRAFWFKGDPAYRAILQAGSIEAVNLANNHSLDYGAAGLQDTVTNLQQADIACFGDAQTAVCGKVGLIGANLLGPVEKGTDLAALKKNLQAQIKALQAKVPIVVVYFHWGTEYKSQVDKQQRELAHFAVDRGADLVVGSHPHVLQEIEQYKGKTIVYSLGNFVFGGNTQVPIRDTMIFQQTFRFLNGRLVEAEAGNMIPCLVSGHSNYNDYRPQLKAK